MVHENLKRIRLAKGVTQLHLAKKIGISNMAYSRMENGETKIDVERLRSISFLLGVDINIFFDEKLTEYVILDLEVS
jgi:transcriptional regulator with XRE-family HTH domain